MSKIGSIATTLLIRGTSASSLKPAGAVEAMKQEGGQALHRVAESKRMQVKDVEQHLQQISQSSPSNSGSIGGTSTEDSSQPTSGLLIDQKK